jgi:hypothetical protein
MSGKSKQVRDNKVKDFAAWWNQRHFHSSVSLHNVFKRLHEVGADVVNIDFFRIGLLLRDSVLRGPKPTADSRRQESFGRFFWRYRVPLRAFTLLFGTKVIAATLGELARRYFPERDTESLLSELDVRKILRVALLVQQLEFLEALKKVPVRPVPVRRGNQADPSGTVFLVEITEHLRKLTGKPHYAEAIRLLRAVRGASRRYSPTDGQSALIRVKNWKKANPNWKDHVDEMTLFFASLGTSKT